MNGITKLRYGLTIVLSLMALSLMYSIFLGMSLEGEEEVYEEATIKIFYSLSASEQRAVTKYFMALPDVPGYNAATVSVLGLMTLVTLILLLVITLLVWSVKEIRGE